MSRNEGRGRMKRRQWFAGLGMLGLLLLFSHQNCAPSNMSATGTAGGSSAGIDPSRPVTIIDDSKSTAAVSFPYAEVEIQSKTSDASLNGICSTEQEGAVLGWKMNQVQDDGSLGAEVAQGYAECSGGSFKVDLASVQGLVCDRKYAVTARLGFAKPGQTVIHRRCGSSQ